MMERVMEDRASSFYDAGLWRKLLEKAKKGTTTECYFAADIGGESLPTSKFPKLGLPAEFLEHHRNKLSENIILEGHDGHKWAVMLGLSWDSKPCLLHGWREFAIDCTLTFNDQILFFLWENSHFLFQVFDSTHNIKRRGVGTSAHIARTTLPQVTDPIVSFGFKTTRPNVLSLPSGNKHSGAAKNVHKENHATQDSPSGEKLGNQEPGVEEDDDRVTDFNANSEEIVSESFQSAPLSDAEEDQAWSLERAKNLPQKTTGRGEGELHNSVFAQPPRALSIYDYIIQETASVLETARDAREPVRKRKEDNYIPEIIPEKRARQAPVDRSQPVSASASKTRQARGMKRTPSDDPDSRATKSATSTRSYDWLAAKIAESALAADVAREAAKAAAIKEGEAAARDPASVTLAARIAAKEAAKAAANKEGEATARDPASVGLAARIAEAELVADVAKEAANAAANKEGEATVRDPASAPASIPASDPVTPLPVEAPKQAFKRPQPRKPSLKQLYYSKRRPVTLKERHAALDAGQRYAVASYNRTHVMQLRASQVYFGNLLGLTVHFAADMELPLQGHKQVTLYDMSGRTWGVVWHAEHPTRIGFASSGWTAFVLDHFLEDGDVCVFELPDPKVCNIAVTVFRVVPLIPTPSRWCDHYTVDEPVAPAVVPAVVQPEADLSLDRATSGQSSGIDKEDSEIEGKPRRLIIDLNSGEKEMNKSCEEDKSNEKDKSSEKEKRCMEETTTEG